jgi:hypothetical protein
MHRWNTLAVIDGELRLGVERVDVREAAGEEDEDELFRPGLGVGRLWREWMCPVCAGGCEEVGIEAQTARRAAGRRTSEKIASMQLRIVCHRASLCLLFQQSTDFADLTGSI